MGILRPSTIERAVEKCAACRSSDFLREHTLRDGIEMWLCKDFRACGDRWRKLPI